MSSGSAVERKRLDRTVVYFPAMERFATMLSGGALGALKVAVRTAMETFLKRQKDKPLTILEREAISEAATASSRS